MADLARSALVEVRQYIGERSWCLNDSMHGHLDCTTTSVRQHMAEMTDIAAHFTPPLVLSTLENRYTSVADLQDTIVANTSTAIAHVYISERSFLIPPRATFLLSSIQLGASVIESASNSAGLSGAIE